MIAIYISDTADIGVEKLVSHWYSTSDIANHVSDTAGIQENVIVLNTSVMLVHIYVTQHRERMLRGGTFLSSMLNI